MVRKLHFLGASPKELMMMTRATMHKLPLLAGLALVLSLSTACGVDDDQSVRARNLLTGELETFPSESDVPPNWVPCQSEACPIPPSVPCQKLSEKVCALNPMCRLKTLWCTGTVSPNGKTPPPAPDGQGQAAPIEPPPPGEKCEYQCIPKLPLLCEEHAGEKACLGDGSCEWGQFVCPLAPCQLGQPCPPCGFTCRKKAPPICQDETDEKSCNARKDCAWEGLACPALCSADGNCPPCPSTGVCKPKTVVPPPCPTLALPPPGFCADGTIEYEKDASGCTVGYTCKKDKTCWDLNAAYIKAVEQAKACNPLVPTFAPLCTKSVKAALFCPICPTYVEAGNMAALGLMKLVEKKWLAADCDKIMVPCPALSCAPPQPGLCKAGNSTAPDKGRCTN